MFEYQLIRSKRRKTLGLQVKHGQITVRAPYHVTSAFIDSFIKDKSSWLRVKILEQQSKNEFCDFSHGSTLLFLGEAVRLNIGVSKQASIYFSDDVSIELIGLQSSALKQLNVIISERVDARLEGNLATAKQVKKQLEQFLKQQAEGLINERLGCISQQISLVPVKTNIRQYRARWGSCNNRGELSFNYLLMMTPRFVIDYVIVHELCHLEYLDHSKNFWQLVEKHSPNYELAKTWLRNHQSQLHWLNPTR
jgi:predicted metal-dependent hydrolase